MRSRVAGRCGRNLGLATVLVASLAGCPGHDRPGAAASAGVRQAVEAEIASQQHRADQGPAASPAHLAGVLERLGFDAIQIRREAGRGRSLVTAALHYQQGQATVAELARLSDTVAVVEGAGVEERPASGDDFPRTLKLKVVQPLKGTKVGEVLAVGQQSGPRADGTRIDVSGEFVPQPGARYLVFGSRAAARGSNVVASKGAVPVVLVGAPWREDSSLYRSTGQMAVPPAHQSEVTAALR